MKSLEDALTEKFGGFVLPFKFRDEHGTRTSHYLVHVTKDRKGYNIMKAIMANSVSQRSINSELSIWKDKRP